MPVRGLVWIQPQCVRASVLYAYSCITKGREVAGQTHGVLHFSLNPAPFRKCALRCLKLIRGESAIKHL
jgi:hypothetical protein